RCAGEVTFPLSASMVPGASAGPAPSSDAATLSPAGIGPDTPTRTGAPPAMAPAVADDPTESLGLPTIPGYQILGVLGPGGIGAVYKARQKSLNRLVALKMILAGSHAGAEELARFKAEAESLATLRPPHIVQVSEI